MIEKPLYHHHTPIRMAKVKQTTPGAGEDAEQLEFPQAAREDVKCYNRHGIWFPCFKLNINLVYNPKKKNVLLGEAKSSVHKREKKGM